MQKRVLVSLVLALSSCSRVVAPSVPNAYVPTTADARPTIKKGNVYTGEDGSLGSIAGTLPSGAETDPLITGGTELPMMNEPVVKMPEEVPIETDPKVPVDPLPEPRSFRTITVIPTENRGTWEGFGAKLGAWANAVGASDYQDIYADLFFTNKNTAFTNTVLPGLGLNIVRYGIGGGGRESDIMDRAEINPLDLAAYRDVEGFWIDPISDDRDSMSFDWSRDANQRSLLLAAKERGISNFEFFSLAPMWWMTKESTTVGGTLQNPQAFAKYLSSVVQYARDDWMIPVTSLAPFNEPTSDRWTLKGSEPGIKLNSAGLAAILVELYKEFAVRDLTSTVTLSGFDEGTPRAGLVLQEELNAKSPDVFEKINIHTSDRAGPSRDVKSKEALRISAGEKRIWVSDHSDGESDGMSLATSIVEDIRSMKATAWIYGQPVDTMSSRGLVLSNFDMSDAEEGVRGRPIGISVKHYILAQFSRFIRPGQQIIGGSDDKSLLAYDAESQRLSVVILNTTKLQQDVDIDLSAFKSWSQSIAHVVTRGDGMKVWKAKSVGVFSKKIRVTVEPGSVSSLEIPEALLK
ncbi:MAG: glycoside hydrolase [Bdellovibrionota bacterium]